MAAPLTDLLRKDNFNWGVQEAPTFEELKQQLSTTPVLSLPDFNHVFVVEANASANGIGADKETVRAAFMALSQQVVGFITDLKEENASLKELLNLHRQLDMGAASSGFRHEHGLIIFQDRYYVGKESKLKKLLLQEFHDTPSAGHGGVKKMLVGLSALFYWPGMRKSVEEYIKQCLVCQQTKDSTQAMGGYLQPLPTPTAIWEDVSMNFITGLPVSKGLSVILMVVDRFFKYAHFGSLPTSFNAHNAVELKFWNELFQLSGTQLNRSTTYHPQKDGQTEVVNRGLEQYLREMVSDRPNQLPLSLILYSPRSSKVVDVDELLVKRDGGEVKRIRKTAYRLAPPSTSMIHPVFHVSILKLFTGSRAKIVTELPKEFQEGQPLEQLVAICDSQLVLHTESLVQQSLVQWDGRFPEEAT
ncbi:ty3-gypsy retrotransposon protein [Tanacetum coccineum]